MKKMITFFDQIDEFLHKKREIDITRDKKYHEIRELFDTVHIQ